MSKPRKKVFPKAVTRADFISRATSQNHVSGMCECGGAAHEHYSSAFTDCPVKRCHHCADCADFTPRFFRRTFESKKSRQDMRNNAYRAPLAHRNSKHSKMSVSVAKVKF